MLIIDKYTLPGVQRLIRHLLDTDGLSTMQLAKQSGVHFTTLYKILKVGRNHRARPIRRSTIMALGTGLGYDVTFDHDKNEIAFERPDIEPTKNNDVDDLIQQIRSILIQSGRKKFKKDEMDRIASVVRAMTQ